MVRPQPSKLMMRVRFPPPAPCKGQAFAHIAQSVEHFLGKEEVTGSNPVMSSSYGKLAKSICLVGHEVGKPAECNKRSHSGSLGPVLTH